RRRPGRARAGAAGPEQSPAQDGERHPHASRRVGLGTFRSGPQAAGRSGDRAGAERALAAELRESGGAREEPAHALAAVLDGARTGRVATVRWRASDSSSRTRAASATHPTSPPTGPSPPRPPRPRPPSL